MADSLEYLNSLNTRRYRCCCGRYHVRKGALVVGTVELFVASVVMCVFCYLFAIYTKSDAQQPAEKENINQRAFTTPPPANASSTIAISQFVFAAGLSFGILYIVAVILMFIGVRRCKARFLLPHLVLQVMTVLCLALAIIFSIVVLATGYFTVRKGDPELSESDRVEKASIGAMIVASVLFVFEIWFFNVIYKCYRYLKARQAYLRLFYGKSPFLASLAAAQQQGLADTRPFKPMAGDMLPWIDSEQ